MEEKIGRQAVVIMQHQLLLENIDGKIRVTNLVVLSVPDEQVALSGVTPDGDELGKVWEVLQDDIDRYSFLPEVGVTLAPLVPVLSVLSSPLRMQEIRFWKRRGS